jgi:hypothetical protein
VGLGGKPKGSRIHGELLMLGFEVAQSTVSKYMVRGGTRKGPEILQRDMRMRLDTHL